MDAECKLMGDKCNFVNFVLIIKVVWVSTIPRKAIDTPVIKMTSQYYYKSLKAKEGITNASDNLNGYVHRYIESRSYTTGYENRSSSDLKCGTRHRGYPGTAIMEGGCTHNPEDWNNKSIK